MRISLIKDSTYSGLVQLTPIPVIGLTLSIISAHLMMVSPLETWCPSLQEKAIHPGIPLDVYGSDMARAMAMASS